MKQIIVLSIIALLAWTLMFCPCTRDLFNFWVIMFISSGTLAGASLFINRKKKLEIFSFKISYIFIGMAAALVLYLIFWIGKNISTYLVSFAGTQIDAIYGIKKGTSPLIIAALLFFWIGPAEEIFWRGFVQLRLSSYFGENRGWIYSSVIYAGIHIASWNIMLITTAFICGILWGYLFKRYRSLWPGMISHAVSDLILFILLPIK